ncbi:WYL domain-containing protein [Methylobacillus sp. Pita2]|uniref:WYL domain-containing protein n=1 Tax=Methylobacillus sp. Pita2 TaxID=3383245 RepID=UPI0038B66EE6
MNNPAGVERIIYPHSIVRAPRRWHIRAWCDKNKAFRDFTLGRIANDLEGSQNGAEMSKEADLEWNAEVKIHITAHPKLTDEQRVMIKDEYFSGSKGRH